MVASCEYDLLNHFNSGKKMRLHLILAATLAASSAHADNIASTTIRLLPVKADLPNTESRSWTGFYTGAQYGPGHIKVSADGSSETADLKGYGLHTGYIHDFGKIVVGGEMDYNLLNLEDYSGNDKNVLFRLRGGYDLGDFMPYATVGIGKLSAGNGEFSETGPAFGFGVSLRTANNVTVSAEYTQQKFTHDFIIHGGPKHLETLHSDVHTSLFQTRASFRF